jgi:hypothetical protein
MSAWSIEARVALVTLFVSILVPILALVGKIVWSRYHSRARSMSLCLIISRACTDKLTGHIILPLYARPNRGRCIPRVLIVVQSWQIFQTLVNREHLYEGRYRDRPQLTRSVTMELNWYIDADFVHNQLHV